MAFFLCASVAAAGMMPLPVGKEGDCGIIVPSVASQDASAATVTYVAAKDGVNGMTLAMTRDLAPEAIRVNTILPSSFDTPLIASVDEAYKDNMRKWHLNPKRFGRPDEYATLALQIIENGYLTPPPSASTYPKLFRALAEDREACVAILTGAGPALSAQRQRRHDAIREVAG